MYDSHRAVAARSPAWVSDSLVGSGCIRIDAIICSLLRLGAGAQDPTA